MNRRRLLSMLVLSRFFRIFARLRPCLGAFVNGEWVSAKSGVDVWAIPGALVIRDKADLVATEKATGRAEAAFKRMDASMRSQKRADYRRLYGDDVAKKAGHC